MGQFISSDGNSNSNDELINSLIRREYIHTVNVEKVFRCVDRGLYYTRDNKLNAYWDRAWQYDKVHLSAPSIYAVVLECLDLHMGHKFLNIGSGVGYFSTVAGLLLGVNGVNHGIELHQSVIDIAYQKLEEFKLNAAAIDYFDLCEPVFIEGNACELSPAGYYDRVYCGAGVPPTEAEFMKSLINIGGVLVMPLDGFLVKITRQSEHIWKTIKVLEVAFSELVVPEKCSLNTVKFPSVEPLSLQELCRSKIRASIRDQLNESFPSLKMRVKCDLNININREEKLFDAGDPLTEYVRLQYGISENGMVNIQNIVNAFAGLDDAISDMASTSENEANEEEDDDDNNSDPVDAGEKTSEQSDEKKTKRTSSEAGCSEQNKTLPEKTENSKRMRMNTSSTVRHTTIGQSSSNSSDLWETVSSNSSEIDNDSGSWVSSIDTEDLEDDDDFGGNYDSLFNDDDDSDTDSEVARESVMFSFLSKRKENELSKLLKNKIDLLPIPAVLKLFLNYTKKD